MLLTQYSRSIDVNKFGGRFKYSKAVSLIDSVDSSITSNITLVTIRRNLKAVLGQFAQYEVCYGNMFHTQESSYNVVSTGFTIEGVTGTVYLADEVINREKGRIFFFTYTEGGTPNIVKKNAGTVDYMHGEVLIDTVNILSTVIANGVIEIQAIPHSNDIVGLRDLYVKFDMTNTTINMVQDLIASGENTSGSRFVHTHSYYTPTLRENQILQFQQLLQFFHQQLLQLQQQHQVVEHMQHQLQHQEHNQLLQPHHHQVVDLVLAADINDRHLNTKSRNQSGN